MASEDTAARVAEIRARHAEYPPPEWSEVAILLAALAAAEAERAHWRERADYWLGMTVAANKRATRLAALEAAARAYAVYWDEWERTGDSDLADGERRLKALRGAVANIPTPPGESS